jgi:phytoene dehydrogenase-like protein
MYDTIIIGAGLSGLAAGIRLGYYGQKVCLLERHHTIGGLNSFYRLRGRDHDVGLHAVTNYAPRGMKHGPLPSLLRRLRLNWDDFELCPQIGSLIAFPDVQLRFSNDFQLLESEVLARFPAQKAGFRRLLAALADYGQIDQEVYAMSARRVLAEFISDPLLVEMLLCPLMWYGNPRERDMDWGPFCILFRSIFLEGLARPTAGIRLILRTLVRRFRKVGGELRLGTGVAQIRVDGPRAVGVILDEGEELEARRILSSAGWVETLRLCGDKTAADTSAGQLSFVESISVLDRPARAVGYEYTNVFFNCEPVFHWEKPQHALCDVRTGVISSPDNFVYDHDTPADQQGSIRMTALANYQKWSSLAEPQYQLAKLHWYDRLAASAAQVIPDFRRYVIDTDFFTPKTIHRFTQRENGAVYGTPHKQWDGRTRWQNVFICGTDQGLVGIVGAMISGVNMANQHCLPEP